MHCKISLDKFVSTIYMPFIKNRKRSWVVDERICRCHISKAFGHLPLGKISRHAVCVWLNGLRESGLAPATCNRILAVLRSICTLALKQAYLSVSPCDGVTPFPIFSRRNRSLNEAEARLLMRELDKYDNLPAYALRLLMLTGARKSEILRARWENIDWQNNILIVPISKSGKARQIVLPALAMKIIRQLEVKSNGPWLFAGRNPERPLRDIYFFWNQIRNTLGLNDVRIHDLRHSFASLLVDMGHSLFEVQNLLGHADPRTTMCYAHMGNNALRNAVQAVEKILAPEKLSLKGLGKILGKAWHLVGKIHKMLQKE